VVRDQPQFEDRSELEELLVQEAGGYRVPTRQGLHQPLGQPTALVHLRRLHHAPTDQAGHVVADALLSAAQEGLEVSGRGVVTKRAFDGLGKGRLPRRLLTVNEDQFLLAGIPVSE